MINYTYILNICLRCKPKRLVQRKNKSLHISKVTFFTKKSRYYPDFFSKKSGYCQSVNLNVLLVN